MFHVQPPSSSIRQVHSFFMVEHILIFGFCFVSHTSGICVQGECVCALVSKMIFALAIPSTHTQRWQLSIFYRLVFQWTQNRINKNFHSAWIRWCVLAHIHSKVSFYFPFSLSLCASHPFSVYLKSREHMESEGILQPKCLSIYTDVPTTYLRWGWGKRHKRKCRVNSLLKQVLFCSVFTIFFLIRRGR